MNIALIKRTPVLDTVAPLAAQLNITTLFRSVGTRSGIKDGGDAKMGIPMTKKKFAELELSLLHLQQNVEIPETHLIIHPIIQRGVVQVSATQYIRARTQAY